ncbi:MAG: lipoyl(octanoyl) transferase LipB [Candidatus Sedimenticola sp. (ex Thyasira tokunagai)]
MKQDTLHCRYLGRREYTEVWREMQAFTDGRTPESADEIWLLEHPPVFTQGQAGKAEHLLDPDGIPVVQSDRGGQVTYHGPGQLVAYLLIDLRRAKLGVRQLVSLIEKSIIALLEEYDIEANAEPKAPGVYVDGRKIAALGLRVRHGCSFHGLSLNVDMDLEPFSHINPCGYAGLAVTQLVDEGGPSDLDSVGRRLVQHIQHELTLRDMNQ